MDSSAAAYCADANNCVKKCVYKNVAQMSSTATNSADSYIYIYIYILRLFVASIYRCHGLIIV